MGKLGFGGLALIALLGAPSTANAVFGSDGEPYNDYHASCFYQTTTQALELGLTCKGFRGGCKVTEVYQNGQEISPFSDEARIPDKLFLNPGDQYCKRQDEL